MYVSVEFGGFLQISAFHEFYIFSVSAISAENDSQ